MYLFSVHFEWHISIDIITRIKCYLYSLRYIYNNNNTGLLYNSAFSIISSKSFTQYYPSIDN